MGGGGGFWDPKDCVPKIARQYLPRCKFRFFPRWSLWFGGGGGGQEDNTIAKKKKSTSNQVYRRTAAGMYTPIQSENTAMQRTIGLKHVCKPGLCCCLGEGKGLCVQRCPAIPEAVGRRD